MQALGHQKKELEIKLINLLEDRKITKDEKY
jgi:hypothetical protein